MTRLVFLSMLFGVRCLPADRVELDGIREIAAPEKRSRQALTYAHLQLEAAVDAYQEHEPKQGRACLALLVEAVELATESLQSTGKHPRRNPRHFKHAEITTRRLLAALRQARQAAILQDQTDFDETIRRVELANNVLLRGILSPGK